MTPPWPPFWACFDHISLIRTCNCAPFFYGLLVLQGIFYQNFKFFSQLARLVPKVSVHLEFIGASSNTEHLGLFRSYLPHPNSESCTIFLMDSLFFKKYFSKLQIFFSTGSTGPQSFSSARVHRSRFKYGALGLVSIISPLFELRIVHHFHLFIYGFLILQGIF